MARSVEAQLAALRKLDPSAPKSLDVLREALRAPSGIVVAAAAKQIGEHRIEALGPELADAFAPLCEEPVAKRDPGCRGKAAIARALHELDHWDDRVFVAGLRYTQEEGRYPQEDTAAELRGICGLAHAHFGRSDALDALAVLLADPERTARVGAAQGLGDAGRPDASALLRYKLLTGDPDPEVLSACFQSLLDLAKESSIDFVAGFLADHDERAEAAALALGGGRITEALAPLIRWCSDCLPAQRHQFGYLALALLRADAANDVLLDAIRTRSRGDALAAARALATFKEAPGVADQLRAAARAHPDQAVRLAVDELLA